MFTITKNWNTNKIRSIIRKFDELSYLNKWHQATVDPETASKTLSLIKERTDAYCETSNGVLHPKRGFGTVVDTIPYDYRMQKIYVRFEEQSDGVFNAKNIFMIVDGVTILYKTKRR